MSPRKEKRQESRGIFCLVHAWPSINVCQVREERKERVSKGINFFPLLHGQSEPAVLGERICLEDINTGWSGCAKHCTAGTGRAGASPSDGHLLRVLQPSAIRDELMSSPLHVWLCLCSVQKWLKERGVSLIDTHKMCFTTTFAIWNS